MDFTRGMDPKQSLGIGLDTKLKSLMKDTQYDYLAIEDVWRWALERKSRYIFFDYVVGLNGKKWANGSVIDVSAWNNELIWHSIAAQNIAAVKALLKIPSLFRKEAFKLDQGTSELEGEFVIRGESKRPMRATNFGVFLNLASKTYPNDEIRDMLMEYYNQNCQK
jgi:hypothetical protein